LIHQPRKKFAQVVCWLRGFLGNLKKGFRAWDSTYDGCYELIDRLDTNGKVVSEAADFQLDVKLQSLWNHFVGCLRGTVCSITLLLGCFLTIATVWHLICCELYRYTPVHGDFQ